MCPDEVRFGLVVSSTLGHHIYLVYVMLSTTVWGRAAEKFYESYLDR